MVQAQADLVGIMEIKSGIGSQLMAWLIAALNNSRPLNSTYTWKGRLSSRQDGGTQEEYLYLWKDEAGVLQLNMAGTPGPTSLIGVADAAVMEQLIATNLWTPAQRTQLLQALRDSEYLRYG
jgi:hypothetical protein